MLNWRLDVRQEGKCTLALYVSFRKRKIRYKKEKKLQRVFRRSPLRHVVLASGNAMLGFDSKWRHKAVKLRSRQRHFASGFVATSSTEAACSFILKMDPCIMYEEQRNASAGAIAVLPRWRNVERESDSLHWNPFFRSYKYDNELLVALKCYADVQAPHGYFILKMWIHFQGPQIILHSPAGTTDKNVPVTNFGWVPRMWWGFSGAAAVFLSPKCLLNFCYTLILSPAKTVENFSRWRTASKSKWSLPLS